MISQFAAVKNELTSNKRLVIENGTVEVLKWLALFLMTLDHFNKYVYNGTIPYLFELGRLAMPLFSFIFAYNLARTSSLEASVYPRVLIRLASLGVISSIPYIALGGVQYGWFPLNILFTLFSSCLIIYIYSVSKKWSLPLAIITFILSGAIVEFWWPAIAMTISAWFYCQSSNKKVLLIWVLSAISLYFINQNFWALLVLPIILTSPLIKVNFPRWRNAFYIYYPGHLTIIWLLTNEITI